MPNNRSYSFQSNKTPALEPNNKLNIAAKDKWWTHVWNGLLLDPGAKHYRAMGRSVWLYLYLPIYANRKTGKLFRRLATVEKDTGIKIRTLRRWLRQLKQNGYVKTRQTGRSLEISIAKWKPIIKKR